MIHRALLGLPGALLRHPGGELCWCAAGVRPAQWARDQCMWCLHNSGSALQGALQPRCCRVVHTILSDPATGTPVCYKSRDLQCGKNIWNIQLGSSMEACMPMHGSSESVEHMDHLISWPGGGRRVPAVAGAGAGAHPAGDGCGGGLRERGGCADACRGRPRRGCLWCACTALAKQRYCMGGLLSMLLMSCCPFLEACSCIWSEMPCWAHGTWATQAPAPPLVAE